MKIKAESFAARCEICHQADCYDPVTNRCTRCASAMPAPVIKQRRRHGRANSARAISENLPAANRPHTISWLASIIFFLRMQLVRLKLKLKPPPADETARAKTRAKNPLPELKDDYARSIINKQQRRNNARTQRSFDQAHRPYRTRGRR